MYDFLYNFFLLINDLFSNKQFRLLVNGFVYYFVNGFAYTSNWLRLRLQTISFTNKRFRLLVIGLILEQAPARLHTQQKVSSSVNVLSARPTCSIMPVNEIVY